MTRAEIEVDEAPPADGHAPPAEADPPADLPPAESAGETAIEETADSERERLRSEAAEMRELAQRKQAEFENYRKRMDRERADLARYAGADVVREILPVLDNLERAVRAAAGSSEQQLREGVAIIHRQFQETLTRMGLSEVESEGRLFDPHIHEAVSQTETEEFPDGTILEVFQKGYLFKDRMLRPAMVNVARAPARGGGPGDQASEDEDGAIPRAD